MGNSLGGKKTAKVMKINGETFKLKIPVKAGDVLKDHPGYVLLESEAVKHYGTRAKPLEPHQDMVPKRLYFLVELPKAPIERNPRRVRSGINMSAKDRLESLMLARRSVSDLSIIKQSTSTSNLPEDSESSSELSLESNNGATRVKLRLPRAQVEKLMQESKDEAEVAAKIVNLCMENTSNCNNNTSGLSRDHEDIVPLKRQEMEWKSGGGRVREDVVKRREKRVSFMPSSGGEMHIAVASY